MNPIYYAAPKVNFRTLEYTWPLTGPRRLPQARTITQWAFTLVVPALAEHDEEELVVSVVYATRYSTEQFTEEDLHGLTTLASTSSPHFCY